MREIQDHAVDGSDLPQDCARVSLSDGDAVRAIRRDVRAQKLDRDRIRVRGVDHSGTPPFRDEDRVRSDAGKGIRDGFILVDEIRNPPPLRGQAGTEVGPRDVDMIPEAVFDMEGRRPLFSCDDVHLAHAERAPHATILDDHPDFRVPPEDRPTDRGPMRPEFFGEFEHDDVADHVEGARQGGAKGHRDLSDILVAADWDESFLELPFFCRKAQVDPAHGRQENPVAIPPNPELFHEKTLRQEFFANRLRPLPRNRDGPRTHAAAKRGCE